MRARMATTCLVGLLALACEDVTDEPTDQAVDDTDHTDDTDSASQDSDPAEETDVVDDTPPTVAVMSPGDGATGVLPHTLIVLTFSEPMDPASVEAAWSSERLDPWGVEFAWTTNDTVLTVIPKEGLPAQPALEVLEGALVDVHLAATATDANGVPLDAPFEASFRVVRTYSTTFGFEEALTGRLGEDGATTTAIEHFRVGDTSADLGWRLVASFDLSPVPQQVVEVVEATLLLDPRSKVGDDPWAALGPPLIELVSSDTLTGLYDKAPVIPDVIPIEQQQDSVFPVEDHDVTPLVAAALDRRDTLGDLVQLRVRMTDETNADGESQSFRFEREAGLLGLTVDLYVE